MVIGILLVVDDRLVGLAGKVRHIHALRRAEQILKPEIPQKHKQQNGKDADRENAREITHALGPLAPALVCFLRQILTHTEKGVLFLRALPPPLDKRTLLIEVLFAGIERFEHLPRRLIALAQIRLHGAERDALKLLGDVAVPLLRRLGAAGDVHERDLLRGVRVIRQVAREHLIEHDAEGIQVAARVGIEALGLLGRDIVHGADGLPAALLVNVLERGDAEVSDLDHVIVRDHDVLRLDVPVDDAVGVRVLQRLADLRGVVQRLRGAEYTVLRHALFERLALDELHDNILRLAAVADIVDRNDIRLREHGDRVRLRLKAVFQLGIRRHLIAQDLDGNIAVQLVAHGLVDDRHTAAADDLQDLVAVVEHLTDIAIH